MSILMSRPSMLVSGVATAMAGLLKIWVPRMERSSCDGADRAENKVQGDTAVSLHAGDELHLGASTVFAVVEGMPERWA